MEKELDKPEIVSPEVKQMTKKSNSGLIVGMVAGICVGVAGLAFGLYGMTKANSPDTGDCNKDTDTSQSTSDNGSSTDKNDTGSKQSTDVNTKTIVGFTSDGFSGGVEYTVSNDANGTHTVKHTIAIASPNSTYGGSYTLTADGTLKAIKNREPYYGESKDITSLLPGKPVDLAVGQIGNGGDTWLIVLLSDGRVATINEYDKTEALLVENAKDIVRVYGNYTDSMSCLGYAQDKTGEIHPIKIADSNSQKWSFKIN